MEVIIDDFNLQEEVTNKHEITIDGVVVVYCFADQNRNVNFNYIIKVVNQELYASNKEYCDTQIQSFIDRIITISNSQQTNTEQEEQVPKYSLI
ncbi:MAG: hypothetical protein ACLRVF_18150 [Clostridium paraputrificum]